MSTVEDSGLQEATTQRTTFRWSGAALACAAALTLLLALHAETVAGLAHSWWTSSAYGHALLVLPICAWLTWRDRAALAVLTPRPEWLALLIVPVGAAGWFVGDLLSIRVGRELSLYLMFVAVVWAMLGSRVTWRLSFQLLYLLLCVPVWSVLIPPLQDATAVVSARSLQAIGVPVFLEGHYMQIPRGQFIVEEVCAGLRFLLATMAIVALHARLTFNSPWLGGLLFVAGVVSAVVFNWVRVDLIVLAGHFYGMDAWLVHNHIEFGWVMFIVGLLPVIWLAGRLKTRDPPTPLAGRSTAAVAASTSQSAVAGALALLLATTGPGASALVQGGTPDIVATLPTELPALPGVGAAQPLPSGLDPVFQGADGRLEGIYANGAASVSAIVAIYATQSEGKEVVNDANSLYGVGWSSGGATEVPTGATGVASTAREEIVRSAAGEGRLLWAWYYVGGRFTTSPLAAKLLQVVHLPLFGGEMRASAVVVLSTPATSTGLREARLALAEVATALLPKLKETLERAD